MIMMMTQKTTDTAANLNARAQGAEASKNLLSEMQALFSLMPGALMAHEGPLPTDEDVEAMFDNMPV
jgi:hypothetical protein